MLASTILYPGRNPISRLLYKSKRPPTLSSIFPTHAALLKFFVLLSPYDIYIYVDFNGETSCPRNRVLLNFVPILFSLPAGSKHARAVAIFRMITTSRAAVTVTSPVCTERDHVARACSEIDSCLPRVFPRFPGLLPFLTRAPHQAPLHLNEEVYFAYSWSGESYLA